MILCAAPAVSEARGCSVIEQLNLLYEPIVQIDETHWEIYKGKKLVGLFEADAVGWSFTTFKGPLIGAGGPLAKGEDITMYLDHAVGCLTRKAETEC